MGVLVRVTMGNFDEPAKLEIKYLQLDTQHKLECATSRSPCKSISAISI